MSRFQNPSPLSIISRREAALGAEARLLREELASAQEAAASAAGHAKQYQALATSSDEALRSMQVGWLSMVSSPASVYLVHIHIQLQWQH